ncbi:MAG: CPBP family intramembrane metalloprotease [Sphingobacteriales bacterium]|nr:CPBP family intramembrane metalloprotease [Sphingobacteriales bacterium]
MNTILAYIRLYLQPADKKLFTGISLFCGAMVFLNYHFDLSRLIEKNNSALIKLFAWYGVFLVALGVPLLLIRSRQTNRRNCPLPCIVLLFLAPLVFALKYTLSFHFSIVADGYLNHFWNKIISWPLFLLMISAFVFGTRPWVGQEESWFGTRNSIGDWKTYGLLFLLALPLVAYASLQPGFQAVYPQFRNLAVAGNMEQISCWQGLLFEGSYGTDFISIELFFRGFLVLAFTKWLGKDMILPAAVFYCSIHFGKPVAECISSFFGGILLGIIVYHTRSIRGVLAVHLGMAWMMEVVGWLVAS